MTLLRRLVELFRGRRREDALMEEMEAHRALAQEEMERAGLTRAEAAAESRRRMGNVTLAREDVREFWVIRWMDRARQHARFGMRGLMREPAFALTAILTLGLGTAATTTVFSVVDAQIWKKLPYRDAGRLIAVWSRDPNPKSGADPISIEELQEWRAAPGLSSIVASGARGRRTARADRAESMRTDEVTANYFSTLGVAPRLGRVFTDADSGGSNAVVVTARGWLRLFDNDPNVVGRQFLLDDEAKIVAGVVADDDSMGPGPELFVPIDERRAADDQSRKSFAGGIGRMAPGATAALVREQLQAAVDRRGVTDPDRRGRTVIAEDLSASYTTTDRRPLYFFLGASLLVLVLTMTNVAALLLARTLRRAPEFALRGALGSSGQALVSQLVVEAALIAIPGGLLGLVLAFQAVGLVGGVVPEEILYRGSHIAIDWRVAAFSLAIALATTVGFALVPAGTARRASPSAALGSGARISGTPAATRMRSVLLVSQLALTVILLAGAGIFLKSFIALTKVPLGFNPEAAWSMTVAPSGPRFASPDQIKTYAAALTEHANAIPGVRNAAVATSSPLNSGWLAVATETGVVGAHKTRSIYRSVSDGYFQVLGTRIVRGRAILPSDVSGAPAVAVVNEQFARAAFGGRDPIGRSIDITGRPAKYIPNGAMTIVGVSENVKNIFLNESTMPDIYVPFAQRPAPAIELLVRTAAGEGAMPAALRAAAAGADPSVPVAGIGTLDRRVERSLAKERFNLIMVAGFAAVAVIIGAIGIYGAMAYAATARRREDGVRLALGATPRGLFGNALWRAARLGMIAGALGVAGAIVIGVAIGDALYLVPEDHNGLLFDVKTTDPAALAGALVGVVVMSLLAGALPARRVSRVNPVTALRGD